MKSVSVQPAYICAGVIVVDDIVLPDGTVHSGVLGGGVVHAAVGITIWDQRPGISTCAGYDLPEPARQRLEHLCDTQGLRWLDLTQARAWQLFEWDGTRTEVPRVTEWEPFLEHPLPAEVPPAYHSAKGIYFPNDVDQLPAWRALYPDATLLWEPKQQYMLAENADEFRMSLRYIDIVSPNWDEAQQVYGFDDPARLVQTMLQDGATIAALRMGEHGSLVGVRDRDEESDMMISVPAVPVPEIIDQTGAGNTYCGGFLVGWLETGDLAQATCYGAVAASFALETIGVATPPPDMRALRDQRYRWLWHRVMIGR